MQRAGAGPPICVWPAAAQLGEGPVWSVRDTALYWTDIKGRQIHRFRPVDGDKKRWRADAPVGCLAPRSQGGFVCAAGGVFAFLDLPETSERAHLTPIVRPEPDLPGNRFNDGACDAYGRFWAGTMDDLEKVESGALWRLDPDGRAHRLRAGFHVPNGPIFSADGARIWVTDSVKREVRTGPVKANGDLGELNLFCRFNESHGFPDGMTLDNEGAIWIAFWDGGCVRRIDQTGEIIEEFSLPVPRPTSIAIGGMDGRTAFVTSARIGLASDDGNSRFALSGGLFAFKLNRPLAVAEPAFAG